MKKIIPFILVLGVFLFIGSAQAAVFDKDLSYGVEGDSQVKKLQEFLLEEGLYSGPITGNYYSLTVKAVKRLQQREGISATGYFGPKTRSRADVLISSDVSSSETPTVPEVNNSVIPEKNNVQTQLGLLLKQIALMQSQLQVQQNNNQIIQNLQEQTQQQTQVIKQQSQTLQQIQQNTAIPETPVVLPTPVITPTSTPILCTPNWVCLDWGVCSDRYPGGIYQQKRTCVDTKNCKVNTEKPIELQYCVPPKRVSILSANRSMVATPTKPSSLGSFQLGFEGFKGIIPSKIKISITGDSVGLIKNFELFDGSKQFIIPTLTSGSELTFTEFNYSEGRDRWFRMSADLENILTTTNITIKIIDIEMLDLAENKIFKAEGLPMDIAVRIGN
jgi:peptidoglycan hydrolase-like protein with peptidoglycan-binding domain